MIEQDNGIGTTTLTPDDAFAVLGNETRIDILRTLGESDEPLSFSALRDRVGVRDSGQFSYHLDKLSGHFISKSDAGYALRAPGRRVVEAVLSGAVTETPAVDREGIKQACQLCGAPIEVRYHQEAVETFCTECGGMWGGHQTTEDGYLGRKLLPPAGVQGRGPEAMYRAAWTWTALDLLTVAAGLCPSCSATLDTMVEMCEDYHLNGDRCAICGDRYAVRLAVSCTNCIVELSGTLPMAVAANTALLDFLTDHGLNPVVPDSIAPVQRVFSDFDEEILSEDPVRVKLTFEVAGDSISLTVDDTLSVIDITMK